MVVPRARLAEVEDIAVATAAGYTPADPITGASLLGPLVSAAQQQRVRDYINKGIDEGARLIWVACTPPEGLEKGYYIVPTIFSDVTQRHDDRPRGDLWSGAVDHSLRH